MKEFVEFIIRHLVDKPEDVKVTELIGKRLTVYEVSVASGDFGKVLGKKGRTAMAIRLLLIAASKKIGRNAYLELIE
ncbi:KH domain-containing protein [candidate division KSB1 bacterium]|nr:KH domain-containing protein [candidate division KSB1 bacterium]MBL7093977.1 KH domain-containing protein [candidate division KSB1 bacterium]